MGADIKRENEAFLADYKKVYDKGTWSLEDLTRMKEYKKLIYYNLAICAMEDGDGFPGSEHLTAGARGRNPMGQFTSGNRWGNPDYSDMGYGTGMGHYPWETGNRYYDDMEGTSGRRYYDSEKKKTLHKLHSMLENTDDPERRSALEFAINVMEHDKM